MTRADLVIVGIVGALCIALLTGCASTFDDAVVDREFRRDTVAVTWREVDDISAHCPDRQRACAQWRTDAPTCTIVTGRNPPNYVLGHETLHCFAGRWHQ